MDSLHEAATDFSSQAPAGDFWSLRLYDESTERLRVRQDVLQPPTLRQDRGAMVTVAVGGGVGYAASADISTDGLLHTAQRAIEWARRSAAMSLPELRTLPRPRAGGSYRTPCTRHWESTRLQTRIDLLRQANEHLKGHERIVDWEASLEYRAVSSLLLTADGVRIEQRLYYLLPGLAAVANRGAHTQRRTHGGGDATCQGGLEQLERIGFLDQAPRVAEEAVRLLDAPVCPYGVTDLLLLPAQMILQIHESIGHPLELDRILGDERNYAGTSFVTPEMFGRYRYGSELLNITYDPECRFQAASYGFDDEGSAAERRYLIRDGILQRPLGSATSQMRSGLPGVANARACGWNRPPIDRMANLNLEPGASTLTDLYSSVENGVLMDTNRSWSIDDSRNKFQFGCEYGQLIRDGEPREIVRNPGYRGISATFWRSLGAVGDHDTQRVLGVANCGKGEPNQAVWVGHASPACVFRGIEVFGGS